ncbi:hypothetical protein [Streptomyces genisteinicus]|uniref:Uncharacterized protein n=1 Tax=Streptomyces genisteinicus TaxID=2768068 RepID=A0A7H0HVT2_9ACTN|nr:hypothetical protein [Streptomyces genisteinicus]QNP64648.1 hypothetical protein IAG43_18155 [Streptomyces genisteinicus]
MRDQLAARSGLLAQLASHLTGIEVDGRRHRPYCKALPPPVLAVVGGRGTGKTHDALRLRDLCGTATPTAYLDCADDALRTAAAESPSSRSLVTEALLRLGGDFVRSGPPRAGALHLPRLFAGLVAVASGAWDAGQDERIAAELGRLEAVSPVRGASGEAARDWAAGLVAAYAVMRPPRTPTEVSVEVLLRDILPRGGRRAVDWYGDYPGAQGDAAAGLTLLGGHFRHGGDQRVRAEYHLGQALRADLEEAYRTTGGWLLRTGRPLMLLDNAHDGPGERLVRDCLTYRGRGHRDRVVVLAAFRREDPPVLTGGYRLPSLTSAVGLAGARGDQLCRHPLVVVPFPPLPPAGPETSDGLLSHVDPDAKLPPGLPRALYRFTGGRPLAMARMTDAVAELNSFADAAPEDGAVRPALPELTLRALLGYRPATPRRTTTGPTVAQTLRGELVPGEAGDLLTLVSPAADAHAAALLLSPAAALTTSELRHALDADGWPRCDEHFVGDHCLRILLLHELWHRDADHASWIRGHQRLAGHYAGASPASPHQYRHELSIGLTRNAVAHLHGSLYLRNTAAWLDSLLLIASAPVFTGIDERRRLAFTGGHHEPERRVERLLNAAWLAQDRLETPEAGLEAATRGALYAMRDDVADGSVLTDAAEHWAESIRSGRPLRECACTRRGRTNGGNER